MLKGCLILIQLFLLDKNIRLRISYIFSAQRSHYVFMKKYKCTHSYSLMLAFWAVAFSLLLTEVVTQ